MEEAVEIILGKRVCNTLKDNKIFSIQDTKKFTDSQLLKLKKLRHHRHGLRPKQRGSCLRFSLWAAAVEETEIPAVPAVAVEDAHTS